MKKILLAFMALIVMSMPFQQTYMEVEAAILSKAGTLTAKKIVKEVIQDAAVNQAANMAVLEAIEIANKYQSKPGFKIVCPTGGTVCDKPVQIKETLTDADKPMIKTQSATELDRLISPGGKGFSRWEKLIDWFIPIWLTAFAVTAITYATDPDVKSLFDEAAYNTLVALGIISPITEANAKPITEAEPLIDGNGEYTGSTGNPTKPISLNMIYGSGNSSSTGQPQLVSYPETINFSNSVTKVEFNHDANVTGTGYDFGISTTNVRFGYKVGTYTSTIFLGNKSNDGFTSPTVTIAVNGESVVTAPMSGTSTFSIEASNDGIGNILTKKMESILYRTPYEVNGNYYTDVLFNTVDGDVLHAQAMSATFAPLVVSQTVYTRAHYRNNVIGTNNGVTTTVYRDTQQFPVILPPAWENSDIGEMESSYQDENGNMALLPPAAFTYIDETTGEQVERVKAPTGDGYTWQKPDGTQVPEENIVPKPDEEPKIAPSPDGVPQYTPAPTPSNPNPEPVPLQPNPTTPTQPPGTEEPPAAPFPDGEKCPAKLQFPIFSPLKEQLSTSFPFSIPWDIERAAHAAFDGVGNEKPKFDMVIPVGDKKHHFTIETPKFMDDWKPFMDGFLLLTFDMLLMFGLYRFVKGAGS